MGVHDLSMLYDYRKESSDPLLQFGALVPSSLRECQEIFKKVLKLNILLSEIIQKLKL